MEFQFENGPKPEHRTPRRKGGGIFALLCVIVVTAVVSSAGTYFFLTRTASETIVEEVNIFDEFPNLSLVGGVGTVGVGVVGDAQFSIEDVRHLDVNLRLGSSLSMVIHNNDTVRIHSSGVINHEFDRDTQKLSIGGSLNNNVMIFIPHSQSTAIFESLNITGEIGSGSVTVHGNGNNNTILATDLNVATDIGSIVLENVLVTHDMQLNSTMGNIRLQNVIADNDRLSLNSTWGRVSVG